MTRVSSCQVTAGLTFGGLSQDTRATAYTRRRARFESFESWLRISSFLTVDAVIEALHEHLQGTLSHALHCPRAASSAGVISCCSTYHHWCSISGLDLVISLGEPERSTDALSGV